MTINITGFYAIHSNHLEDLRLSLIHLMRTNPLAPLQSEQVLVQSNGIAQWLKLSIAESPSGEGKGGIGIAADIDISLPSEFIWRMYRQLLPEGSVPKETPFDKRRLVWMLFQYIPELVSSDSVYVPLRRFLDGPDPTLRIYQLAEKLADLFDQYQSYRADWLAAWEQGNDVVVNAKGVATPLEGAQLWQSSLWRFVVNQFGGDEAEGSRAKVHTRFMQLPKNPDEVMGVTKIPKRVFVFGISSLSYQMLEALSQLSCYSQVIFCVLNPSEYYWANIVSHKELLQAERRRGKNSELFADHAQDMHINANPLLSSFGRQGRDFVRLLDEFDDPSVYTDQLNNLDLKIDIFSEFGESGSTKILHQIQNDIFKLKPLSEIDGENRFLEPNDDDSVTFHVGHSPMREVEILHDQLLAALNSDVNLEPKDIMVMVPDVTKYAPFIKAVFGKYPRDSKRYIPFALSDQGERARKPVLVAIDMLLSLPRLRFTSSEILGLLDVPALRNKFGIREDQLPTVRRWVEGANIRWGLNAEQRQSLDIKISDETNSWVSGLRSMLLGFAIGNNETWAGVESYSEVSGIEASVAGALAELLRQLESLWRDLKDDRSIEQWSLTLNSLVDTFFDDADDANKQLLDRFKTQVEKLQKDIEIAGANSINLPLQIVTERVLSVFDETSLNHKFASGRVNFASLMPMRAIPFKRICILGMNDGEYPRSRTPLDFDLMGYDYRPGDRSRRHDDRYLFLESLLSARDQLYISWVGRSIQDDSERPSSVLVEQLRDYISSHWKTVKDGKENDASESLTIHHPLQPFSHKYFDMETDSAPAQELMQARKLFTFAKDWEQAFERKDQTNEQLRLEPIHLEQSLGFSDISNFMKRPIEQFFKRRLQVYFDEVQDDDLDSELFQLKGLNLWKIEKQIIDETVLTATSEDNFKELLETKLTQLSRRGDLGIASTAIANQGTLKKKFQDVFAKYSEVRSQWPIEVASVDVSERVQFTSDNQLLVSIGVEGEIDRLFTDENGELSRIVIAESKILVAGSKSSYIYSNLIRDWVIHLVGQIQQPFQTIIIGKETNAKKIFDSFSSDVARQLLKQTLEMWYLGMTYPLPLDCAVSCEWINNRYKAKAVSEEHAIEKAEEQFEKVLGKDKGYLRASYPNFEVFCGDGDFVEMSKILYGPLWLACHKKPVVGVLDDK